MQTSYSFGPTIGAISAPDKAIVGGKGHSLLIMTNAGLPVPPGFIIPIPVMKQYLVDPLKTMDEVEKLVTKQYKELHHELGRPPIVAVRSGAPISMPGMMDTILNVGLMNYGEAFDSLKKMVGEVSALDSFRRLLMMYGTTVLDMRAEKFPSFDPAVNCNKEDLVEAIGKSLTAYADDELKIPEDPVTQIVCAVEAVFKSWNSERAIIYRQANGIPDDLGTAAIVQAMVFGNAGMTSCSGVGFTRDPSTGENGLFGEFLVNAQGEDVVAGTHTPLNVTKMIGLSKDWKKVYGQLEDMAEKLEDMYCDMVDFEFTVENGKLYMLQSRVGKRTDKAAVRIALDMLKSGKIGHGELKSVLKIKQVFGASKATSAKSCHGKASTKGLAGGGGAVIGKIVTSATSPVLDGKEPCILVVEETTPEDIGGMLKAKGFLTMKGGVTSHAAVVARSLNLPCVTSCEKLHASQGSIMIGGQTLNEGDQIAICGDSGLVWIHPADVVIEEAVSLVEELAEEIAAKTGQVMYGYGKNRWIDALTLTIQGLDKDLPGLTVVNTGDSYKHSADKVLWDAIGNPLDALVKSQKVPSFSTLKDLIDHGKKNKTIGLTPQIIESVFGSADVAAAFSGMNGLPALKLLGGGPIETILAVLEA